MEWYMLRNLQFSTFLLLMLPFTAHALPVTLQSDWRVHTLSCPSCVDGLGVFTFTYDDATPPISISGQGASYLNAITSATFMYGNLAWSIDDTVDNYVSIKTNMYISGSDGGVQLSLLDDNHTSWRLILGFEDYDATFVTSDLNNLIGLDNDDTQLTVLWPPGCNTFACGGYALNQLTPLTPVSIPSAAWLLGTSLLGLAGVGRKRRAA